jgi:drug/metabolite transporter (DMT)-like permease
MPRVSQLFFRTAIVLFIIGIAIGLHMGISEDHSAFPAHAHINLLGWVTSAIFGAYYALNPVKAQRRVAMVQFWVYNLGLLLMLPALYLKYTGTPEAEPVLAFGSLVVGVGVLIFAYIVFSSDGD